MKIKSFVWYWLAMACFVVGLLYGMGLEGSFQTGGTVSDADFITADAELARGLTGRARCPVVLVS